MAVIIGPIMNFWFICIVVRAKAFFKCKTIVSEQTNF